MGQSCCKEPDIQEEATAIAFLAREKKWDEVMQRIDKPPFKSNMDNLMKIEIYGHTLLHRAAEQGNFEMVKQLIDIGFDVNCLDRSRHSPVGFACTVGNLDIVKYFVEHGADINIIDISYHGSLYAAATRGHLPVVKYLVDIGADINQRCIDRDWTPAQWARYWKRDECADYLDSIAND